MYRVTSILHLRIPFFSVIVARPAPPDAPLHPVDYMSGIGARFDQSGNIIPHSILGSVEDFKNMALKHGDLPPVSRYSCITSGVLYESLKRSFSYPLVYPNSYLMGPCVISYKTGSKTFIVDISGINEKFNIGIYYGAKDNFFCIFIGPEYTKFPVIRENNFTLIAFLVEEFGSSTISYLFQKHLVYIDYEEIHLLSLSGMLKFNIRYRTIMRSFLGSNTSYLLQQFPNINIPESIYRIWLRSKQLTENAP